MLVLLRGVGGMTRCVYAAVRGGACAVSPGREREQLLVITPAKPTAARQINNRSITAGRFRLDLIHKLGYFKAFTLYFKWILPMKAFSLNYKLSTLGLSSSARCYLIRFVGEKYVHSLSNLYSMVLVVVKPS